MTNSNSLLAWERIKDTSKLSELRQLVAWAIAENPCATAGEIYEDLANVQQHSVTPRFRELERMGVIVRREARPCKVTGHMADTYEINPAITEETIVPLKPTFSSAPKIKRIASVKELLEALHNGEEVVVRIGDDYRKFDLTLQTLPQFGQDWDYLKKFQIFRFRLATEKIYSKSEYVKAQKSLTCTVESTE